MKAAKLAIGIVALALLVTAFAPNVSADTKTISPGAIFSVTGNLEEDELVSTWYWTATGNLHFTLRDPTGALIDESTSTADNGALDVFTYPAGEYTFTWENTGSSSVSLTYNVGFMDIEEGLSTLVLMMVIIAVIVVVVIVVIILVVVLGGKKKAAAMAPGMAGPMPMAPVGGNCPRCGTPIPAEGMFCAKCGAKIR
jgi:hypothetical protein